MPAMDYLEYIEALRRDGGLLAEAAGRGLDAAVPSCPGWTVAHVVAHTGAVHRNRGLVVAERLDHEPDESDVVDDDEVLAGGVTVEWYRDGLDGLVAALEANGPEVEVWTWHTPDQTIGFWARRMAHETFIHRVDAELGHGPVSPIDVRLATDGVAEIIDVYVGGVPAWAEFSPEDVVARLEATDAAATWDVRFGSVSGTSTLTGTMYRDLTTIVRVDPVQEPAVTITGPAADLDLWLWGRGSIDRLETEGDVAVAERLRQHCAGEMD
jgi:uncharacterized protein (TIGR03083 family)